MRGGRSRRRACFTSAWREGGVLLSSVFLPPPSQHGRFVRYYGKGRGRLFSVVFRVVKKMVVMVMVVVVVVLVAFMCRRRCHGVCRGEWF